MGTFGTLGVVFSFGVMSIAAARISLIFTMTILVRARVALSGLVWAGHRHDTPGSDAATMSRAGVQIVVPKLLRRMR